MNACMRWFGWVLSARVNSPYENMYKLHSRIHQLGLPRRQGETLRVCPYSKTYTQGTYSRITNTTELYWKCMQHQPHISLLPHVWTPLTCFTIMALITLQLTPFEWIMPEVGSDRGNHMWPDSCVGFEQSSGVFVIVQFGPYQKLHVLLEG